MKYLVGLVVLVVVVLTGVNTYEIHFKEDKVEIVFVNTPEVFDAFILKQEMEKKYQDETKNSSRYLDSLAFEIQSFSDKMEGNEERVDKLKALYYQKRNYHENYASKITREYDSQILVQMKQYIKDFGKENGYEYVLGTSSDGWILFGNNAKNVTSEVIEFINFKYQGE